MTSNNHRAVLVSANLGCAHDYDPKTVPLARMKKKNTLTAGRLYISASLNEILAAREMIKNPQEFESIFGDVKRECNQMTELGTRLAQQSSKWNPRRWLEHRRDIKKFSDAGYDLYILTVKKSATLREQQLPAVSSEDIIPVTMDEVSPTEPVDGMLVTVDDGVDIDQANHDIAETMNELTSAFELQENHDADCSDTLSIAPSELSYLTARTSCETDQPKPRVIPPTLLSNHNNRSGVPPAGHWPPTTSSLPSTIDAFSPVNPPPTNPSPMSPPLTSPSPTSPSQTSPSPTSPPPTSPPTMGPPPSPTATSSPRANSPPPTFSFQNNTFVCTNLLLHALNDLRLNSGNGSIFSDHNTGASNMKTFPQEFMPTSPSN